MEPENQTFVKEFILNGFPQETWKRLLLFLAVLLMYICTVLGNMFLIVAVIFSPKLHVPMYFFLCNLSFLDVCFPSTFHPKVFVDFFSVKRTISITGCTVQMYMGIYLGSTESFLLAVMAYDRYAAISFPLYYNIIMSWKTCRKIIIVLWPGSFFISVLPVISRPLVFCILNNLDHFVCDLLPVLQLACGNLVLFRLIITVVSLFTLILPLLFIMVSYIFIISSIMKIQSTDGKTKAFSTCASHLTVVSLYYGTCIGLYMGQMKSFSSNVKYISLLYGVITPVLNPLIYSLRNKDVKNVFQKIFVRVVH
uniref:Olfactory receptor n=1 Tax=Pyxicephalus adspersus TaxID=30357 RepID=A0AAV3A3N2_PYXAD|nr:TPA: hypothetical protein GDO54_009964 [Pyxicephalus adspersus]